MVTEGHSANPGARMGTGKGKILLGKGCEGSKVAFVGACEAASLCSSEGENMEEHFFLGLQPEPRMKHEHQECFAAHPDEHHWHIACCQGWTKRRWGRSGSPGGAPAGGRGRASAQRASPG